MDLWDVFEKELLRQEFGSKQLVLNTGARHALSLNTVQDRATELSPGECVFRPYSYDKRYLLAKDLGPELLLTAFDVNTSASLALRSSSTVSDKDMHRIAGLLSGTKRPNLEIRAIGLQNSFRDDVLSIQNMRKLRGGALAEADLFGDSLRHIAMDTKTGMAYNLLLLNRIYRPGELLSPARQAGGQPPAPSDLRFILPEETRAGSHK